MRNKRDIHNDIVDILIQSQYWFWVNRSYPDNPTAQQVADKEKEAVDYFLGRTLGVGSIGQIGFRNIIQYQTGFIMNVIEKSPREIKEESMRTYIQMVNSPCLNPQLKG